jgi:ABC-type lipoprotein release transport system permease subunit
LPGRSKIGRENAPLLFAEVEDKLRDLRSKVRLKCNDDDLETKIKERVEIYLGTAQEYLMTDDWHQAKHNLLQAARCL